MLTSGHAGYGSERVKLKCTDAILGELRRFLHKVLVSTVGLQKRSLMVLLRELRLILIRPIHSVVLVLFK